MSLMSRFWAIGDALVRFLTGVAPLRSSNGSVWVVRMHEPSLGGKGTINSYIMYKTVVPGASPRTQGSPQTSQQPADPGHSKGVGGWENAVE
ncbi:hypothetical protein BD324DRAFT_640077 [Kockovaella imperatae]|uniref:Uncharacterized protein n=1 Tax=Kockovaella imperatae TaxID=4999 RepID=A0A1Y1U773_9TREE|nr:hypothetical protein BD324DRAFT_640077 [Kockovaella imperatae]ORX33347.1 hypothetical protein BD324DRAFT_640077 [Kockovaella imperatae]